MKSQVVKFNQLLQFRYTNNHNSEDRELRSVGEDLSLVVSKTQKVPHMPRAVEETKCSTVVF